MASTTVIPMTSALRPVNLNNQGADFVLAGRLDEAARAFKEAIKATRDLLQLDQDGSHDAELPRRLVSENCQSLGRDVWVSDANNLEGCTFLVYQAPLIIQDGPGQMPLNRLNAVILFNLALSCHLKAMQGIPSYSFFERVVQLYEHSYKLMPHDEDDRFIMLTILNNLVHIHYRLQHAQSVECLCSALWEAMMQGETKEKHSSLFEGLFTNVVIVAFKHSQSAPAA
jgi:hypothetical protein